MGIYLTDFWQISIFRIEQPANPINIYRVKNKWHFFGSVWFAKQQRGKVTMVQSKARCFTNYNGRVYPKIEQYTGWQINQCRQFTLSWDIFNSSKAYCGRMCSLGANTFWASRWYRSPVRCQSGNLPQVIRDSHYLSPIVKDKSGILLPRKYPRKSPRKNPLKNPQIL